MLCFLEESLLSFSPRNPSHQPHFHPRGRQEGTHSSPVQPELESPPPCPCSQLCTHKCKGKTNTFPFPCSFPEVPFRARPLMSKLLWSSNRVLLPSAPRGPWSTEVPREEPLDTEFNKLLIAAPSKTPPTSVRKGIQTGLCLHLRLPERFP